MSKMLFVLLLSLPLAGFAQKSQQADGLHHYGLEWTPILQVGMDLRMERDEDQATKPRTMINIGAGVEHGHWLGELEYASFSQSSGNESLGVSRKFETVLAWMYWEALDSSTVAPYLGAGLGALHESIDTKLLGTSDHDESPWNILTAAAMGLRFFPKTTFWVSGEGRLYKSARLDPDPQLGALLRVGIVF